MGTVTIGADTFDIYGTLAGATSYLAGGFGPAYTKWKGLTADPKAQTLIQAKRYFDSLLLQLAGSLITYTTVIVDVINASYEMASLIALNPGVVAALTSGSNIQSIGAGPTAIQFFAPVKGPPLPVVVMALIGKYLPSVDVSDGTNGGGEALGTGACPTFTPRCTCASTASCCTCEGGINYSRSGPL